MEIKQRGPKALSAVQEKYGQFPQYRATQVAEICGGRLMVMAPLKRMQTHSPQEKWHALSV